MAEHRTIRIRSAAPGDADTIAAFNRAVALESEGKTLDASVLAAGVRAALSDADRCAYLLAEVAGAVAGQLMLTYEWSDWRNGWFWWIQSVYVDPSFRRRGVFRALYEHVGALARARDDVRGVRLYVHEENARAIETYRALGMSLSPYRVCEEAW